MSHPVTTFAKREKVGRIIEMLRNERFDGFPVVESSEEVSRLFKCSF